MQTFIQGVAALKDAPRGIVARVLPSITSRSQVIVPHHLEDDDVLPDDVAKSEEADGVEHVATEISEVINAVEEGKVRKLF